MLDNLTYGRTDSCESESTRLSKLQQCEATDMDLKGNESYNLAPTTSVQDEGEYSYPIFNVVSPTQMD